MGSQDMTTRLNATTASALPAAQKSPSTYDPKAPRNRPAMSKGLLPDALSVYEAAAELGCHAATLNRLRVKGGGPRYILALGRVTYRKEWLVAWLEAQARTSTTGDHGDTQKAVRS